MLRDKGEILKKEQRRMKKRCIKAKKVLTGTKAVCYGGGGGRLC